MLGIFKRIRRRYPELAHDDESWKELNKEYYERKEIHYRLRMIKSELALIRRER